MIFFVRFNPQFAALFLSLFKQRLLSHLRAIASRFIFWKITDKIRNLYSFNERRECFFRSLLQLFNLLKHVNFQRETQACCFLLATLRGCLSDFNKDAIFSTHVDPFNVCDDLLGYIAFCFAKMRALVHEIFKPWMTTRLSAASVQKYFIWLAALWSSQFYFVCRFSIERGPLWDYANQLILNSNWRMNYEISRWDEFASRQTILLCLYAYPWKGEIFLLHQTNARASYCTISQQKNV